jgi:hypothetical protein
VTNLLVSSFVGQATQLSTRDWLGLQEAESGPVWETAGSDVTSAAIGRTSGENQAKSAGLNTCCRGVTVVRHIAWIALNTATQVADELERQGLITIA